MFSAEKAINERPQNDDPILTALRGNKSKRVLLYQGEEKGSSAKERRASTRTVAQHGTATRGTVWHRDRGYLRRVYIQPPQASGRETHAGRTAEKN